MKRRAQFAARWGATGLAGCLLCAGVAAHAADRKDHGPKPAVSIAMEPLGYRPPGKLYLLARYSSSSVDFLDPKHILLTFRQPHLLRRSEGSDGLDQVVRAEVLDLTTGQVTAADDWLLHDRGRYLWRLGRDHAMLRVGSRLYEVDAKLHARELYRSPTELEGVDATPDGRMLVIEDQMEAHSAEEHDRLVRQAALRGAAPPPESVRVVMVRLDGPKVVLQGKSSTPGEVPATVDGFFRQSQRKEDDWGLDFVPYETAGTESPVVQPVAEVASTCAPQVRVLNPQTVLMLSCLPGQGGRYIAAFSRDGQKLWDGNWDANYTWPAFRVSEDGSTVAISWLQLTEPVSATDPIDDDDVRRQVLSVLDSRTGKLRFAMLLDPIVSAGGNFALSGDGKELAVLNKGELQVYDLAPAPPPVAAAERAAK